MSKKKTFVTLEQLKEIDKTYPTPYHLYDEKGIRENAKRLKEAFSWNKGYIPVQMKDAAFHTFWKAYAPHLQ